MKRLLSIIIAIVVTNTIVAQNAFDALKFSQIRYEGSARTIAMGNAFGSLGGDTYAMSINPASSAIYRYSEFTFTPSLGSNSTNTNYLNNRESEKWTRIGISNLGFAGSIKIGNSPYGLKSISFGVAVNKLNNYTSRSYTSGLNANSSWLGSLADGLGGIFNGDLDINDQWNPFYDFPQASWKEILSWNSNLLDPLPDSDYDYIGATENISGQQIVLAGELKQEFYRERKGNLSEIVFNAGANISDKLFFGINLGMQSISFNDYQKYSESAVNPALFDSKFSSFSHLFEQNSNGVGLNAKFGFIALPFAGLRVGGSISTPTWLLMSDQWEETIDARYSDGYKSKILSPVGEYNYRVTSPFRWNIGASYVLGKFAIISVDYEGADYSKILMMSESFDKYEFNTENKYIETNFQAATNLRVGAEVRPMDFLALRAGYSKYGNPEKSYGYEMEYISGGVGFTSKGGTFLDLGFQKLLQNSETYSLYSDYTNHTAPVGNMDISGWKFLMTLGFRF
ncbi:MAG: hypothetical protein CVU10_02935 [Bacteroidetes bacterium HGW-Bacteroidetes-5]|jgi:hypothetical protein|nr:MAG: hypothetical protein CVU10_02935 [Bacteroidetes bacterium HGW-Bacteroidetes-5]